MAAHPLPQRGQSQLGGVHRNHDFLLFCSLFLPSALSLLHLWYVLFILLLFLFLSNLCLSRVTAVLQSLILHGTSTSVVPQECTELLVFTSFCLFHFVYSSQSFLCSFSLSLFFCQILCFISLNLSLSIFSHFLGFVLNALFLVHTELFHGWFVFIRV